MSTNYYIACKTCKHRIIHLGKITSWKPQNIKNDKLTFISNYNLFGLEEIIKHREICQILINEYGKEVTNQEFMKTIRDCDLETTTAQGDWC